MATGGDGARRRRRTGCGAQGRRTGGGAEGTLTEMEHVIKAVVTVELHTATALKVMTYVAFIWSTVVLLGGYISLLQRKDFQCLTVITVIEAYSIFNDTEAGGMLKRNPWNIATGAFAMANLRWLRQILKLKKTQILAPFFLLPDILDKFYGCGPYICIGLSSWRLRHRAYAGASNGDASLANLTTALDFFYALVLCQGALDLSLRLFISLEHSVLLVYQKASKNISSETWFMKFVEAYSNDIRERCAKDLAAAEQVSLLSYAVGLLESGSQEEYLSAARMLDYLIKNGQDASTLILGSRWKAQRLLDTLGITQGSTELRLLAARIVADLAGGIRLAQFPGSLRCVSSLLEATDQPCCTNPHPSANFDTLQQQWTAKIQERMPHINMGHGKPDDKESESSCCCDELIVQGLTILQRLARDPHNSVDICQDLGLLAKITAPIHSHTLIDDMAMNTPWVHITNCSLRVVHQLIHVATGEAATMLRRQISSDNSSDKQAVTNLKEILYGERHQLQMRAMEILSELVLDSSLNISEDTGENLVRKQLQIFLADGGEQEQEVSEQVQEVSEQVQEVAAPVENKTNKTPINNKEKEKEKEKEKTNKMSINSKEKEKTIKATAGETLSTLSNKSQTVSRFVMEEHSDIVDRLTQMLHPKNNIRYRAMSAQILGNLCIHCKEHVSKERGILLPKVLAEILATKTKTKPEASRSIPQPDDNEGTHEISSEGNDVEMQLQRHTDHKASDQENEDDMKELQEALLSLTFVIIQEESISSDIFARAVHENAPDGALVDKLKAIVDDNCHCQATPVSLKIVKLCCQISESVFAMRGYCTGDQKERFVDSFSKASKTLANLEGCILLAGTGRGIENTARPLLSELKEQLEKPVA
ncbi:hypothetical protein ABZP36_009915 [Zizania latifolia]